MIMVMRLSLPVLLCSLALWVATAEPVAAEDGDAQGIPDSVRKRSISKLGRTLKKKAYSSRAPRYRDEIIKILESLEVLGGREAGEAALGAVALADKEVRDRAFALVELEHHEDLVKPLALLLEDKRFRRDEDLKSRVAKVLSVMDHPSAIAPLTGLIRTDEEPSVVAAAAESLATYVGAPLRLRRDAVKRLVDTYTSTWNLMMSVREEDKIMASKMRKQWNVYGRAVRTALQSLTGQQLSRAQEWRRWWNRNKKRNDW